MLKILYLRCRYSWHTLRKRMFRCPS